jgi:hypothetical protein
MAGANGTGGCGGLPKSMATTEFGVQWRQLRLV